MQLLLSLQRFISILKLPNTLISSNIYTKKKKYELNGLFAVATFNLRDKLGFFKCLAYTFSRRVNFLLEIKTQVVGFAELRQVIPILAISSELCRGDIGLPILVTR